MVSGYYIPEGSSIQLNQYAANHSYLSFDEPEAFEPERWLSDSPFRNDKLGVVQPFSIGARNCIGKKYVE